MRSRVIAIVLVFLFIVFTGYAEDKPGTQSSQQLPPPQVVEVEEAEEETELVKKVYELTEIERLKLDNVSLRKKDVRHQFDNLRRNLSTALDRFSREEREVMKEVEERLGIEQGSYVIKGKKVVMKEVL